MPAQSPFKQINLQIIKEIKPALQPYVIVPCFDGGFLVQYKDSCVVSRYDPNYNLLWEKEIGILPHQYSSFKLTFGRFIGVHGTNAVLIYDDKANLLYKQDHSPWKFHESSDCFFAPPDSEGKEYIWFYIPENGGARLQVLDASNFAVIDSIWQEGTDYHYSFHSTPDSNKIFIHLAAGQDGCQLLEAQLIDQKISLKALHQCNDLSIWSFSPNGKEAIFTDPYGLGRIVLFSFPDMEILAETDEEELFADRDEFPAANTDSIEDPACFLSDNIIMIRTGYGRFLLVDRTTLQCIGEMRPEGCHINAFDHRDEELTDATVIMDYDHDIFDVTVTEKGQLIIITSSNGIKIYHLPKEL